MGTGQAATISYFLDQSNTLPDGTNYLQVTIDDEGVAGEINFTVTLLSPLTSIADTNFGIQKFGFNTASTPFAGTLVGLLGDWTSSADTTLDGFGEFVVVTRGKGSARQDPLTFSIIDIDDDVPDDYAVLSMGTADQGNQFFAAHVAGFLHEGTGAGSAFFGGSAVVPLPAAAWLFGSALMGLVVVARRRRGALQTWADEA